MGDARHPGGRLLRKFVKQIVAGSRGLLVRAVKALPVVESPLPCLADLSLRVLEDFSDPFEVPADVGTLGMDSPAAHFSQFDTDLSEAHLDVAQPAVNSSWPAEATPALLGLVVRLTS